VSKKDAFKRFIASQPALEKAMFHLYRWRNRAGFEKEVASRANSSIFNYEKLSGELPYFPEERVIDNNLYGYARALKNYAGLNKDLKAYMEHGLFLGGIVHKDQHYWHYKKVITLSQARVEILKEKLPEKTPVAVGPYIHYARPLLSDNQQRSLKKQLGRVLLVFPFHSMKGVKASFAESDFVAEIKQVAKDFDTVIISMYYLDALDQERTQPYLNEGFKISTAGHRYDRNFVNRQRTHIELADMTMSNGMGTQTGFCIYLGKPHYIFNQRIAQTAASEKEKKRFEGSAEQSERERVQETRDLFCQLYSEYSDNISEEQYRLTADYWGFDQVKTPAELRAIFG